MTICNVWISRSRALVAVDTLATRPRSSEAWDVDKLFVFPRCNAVLVAAGTMALQHVLVWQLLQHQGDFDFMARALPPLVDLAFADVQRQLEGHGLDASDLSPFQSVVLVGWSETRGAMHGVYQVKPPGLPFEAQEEVAPYVALPDMGTGLLAEEPESHEKMQRLASKQVAWGKSNYPHLAIGGRLLVAELERDTMRISSHAI